MVKIKGYRFECEVCKNLENKLIVCSIQVFFRKDGSVSYARARHCGSDKRFYYHQQSLEYVNEKLGDISNIEHGQVSKDKTIDQTNTKPSSTIILEPSAGFGPATITLPR